MKRDESQDQWPCDWKGAELFVLRRGAARSFRENLIWLEEMTEFAERFSKAPSVPNPGFPKACSR